VTPDPRGPEDSSVELADPLSPPVEYDDNDESGVNREIRNEEGEDEENDVLLLSQQNKLNPDH